MHESSPTLLWFRQDLRLQDNPALQAACERGQPVIPLYILDWEGEGEWAPGGAACWWLHHALADLAAQLEALGLRLILRRGDAAGIIETLVQSEGAGAVYWNRRYEPAIVARDKAIKTRLKDKCIDAQSFNAALLFEPWAIENKTGGPYKVFTPFWKACLQEDFAEPPVADLNALREPTRWPQSEQLKTWQLLPKSQWDTAFYDQWQPTREGGLQRLQNFLREGVEAYGKGRDRPDRDGTSCLSPYLHWGQLSPREIHDAVANRTDPEKGGARTYIAELGWREFSYHILYHFPEVPTEPLREEFADFPWEHDAALLQTWQKGQTGYPLVDAGMRQLWAIGWMHNRVRMNVASFLVKHLQQPWQSGARWFWDTLVDADLASNTQGWQWTAGCGADGAPYFRVFNPILQGQRFDISGDYVRRWVPELAKLPNPFIHCPWEAPQGVLAAAGVTLGRDYPMPIIEHKRGRDRALSAYDKLKHFSQPK